MKGIEAACIGQLRKDAELRTAKSGREWLAIPLVVGEGEDAQYVAASSFQGDLALLAGDLKAGTRCYVEGKLKVKLWENNGQPTPSIWLTASVVQPLGLIGQKRQTKPRRSKTRSAMDAQAPIRGIENGAGRPFDDELPF